MLKKMLTLSAAAVMIAMVVSGRGASSAGQDLLAMFKDNHCVNCHSSITTPLKLTSHYADWHISSHREKGVGCEKCHGGDPTAKDAGKAHTGVLPSSDANSAVNPKKLPDACSTCHKQVVSAFITSKHYQNLKGIGLGPSCSTCHAHMVTEVAYLPEQAAKLCATCHDSNNALMPKRPDIPVKVDEVMRAIRRANTVVLWADRLVEQAREKKLDMTAVERDMKASRAMMSDAKTGFHTFDLDAARRKADAAFESGTKIKDALRKQLYPGQ